MGCRTHIKKVQCGHGARQRHDQKIKTESIDSNKKGNKAAPSLSLFGPHATAGDQKNPFFQQVDKTPESVKFVMMKQASLDILDGTAGMKGNQMQQAFEAINAHFCTQRVNQIIPTSVSFCSINHSDTSVVFLMMTSIVPTQALPFC